MRAGTGVTGNGSICQRPARYSFLLNPYRDTRLSKCPQCERPTHPRKFPLVIHVEKWGPLVLGKTCRYYARCELIIVHQDELEPLLTARLRRAEGPNRPLDYLVLGTVEPQVWRKGLAGGVSFGELLLHMADFSRHMQIEQTGHGWGPTR